MYPKLMIIMLFLLIPSSFAYASNDYIEYRHKTNMSLCKIDHIKIQHFYITNIKRKSIEEYEKYCRGVELKSDEVEIARCHFEKEPSYSKEKKENLSHIIKNLYASHIAELIGIETTDNPTSNSFLGQLEINVEYTTTTRSDGTWYSVSHRAELTEQALSRTGREGFMNLNGWHEIGSAKGIENADMVALNLVTKVVNQMKKTFQEANVYCTTNNLIQQ